MPFRSTPVPTGLGGFMLAFTVAQIGAYVGFIPLLSILLPLKVQALDAAGRATALSGLLVAGGIIASMANIFGGWLSDRAQGRGVSRGRLMAWGAMGVGLSLGLIGLAHSLAELAMALLLLQFCLNLVLAPLAAVLTDQVPLAHRGRMAGWLSISYPVATLFSALLVGDLLRSDLARYGGLILVVLATVLPFALRLRRRPIAPAAMAEARGSAPAWRRPAFRRLWLARFGMQCAFTPLNSYVLFYVEDMLGRRVRPEVEAALLISLSTVAGLAAGPVLGHLASTPARRSALAVLGGGLQAAGLVLLAAGKSPGGAMAAAVLIGAGFGGYTALDTALASEVVAAQRSVGRDLGLLNLGHTLPQIIAPLFAGLVLGRDAGGAGYPLLFGGAAVVSLLAGLSFAGASAAAVDGGAGRG